MFGITEGGHSVSLHIHNFLPYLYVSVNRWVKELDLKQRDALKEEINKRLFEGQQVVLSIETLQKASVMGYTENLNQFLKIYVALPKYVNQIRQAFER
jgi:DNA polymerase delta subunit 1